MILMEGECKLSTGGSINERLGHVHDEVMLNQWAEVEKLDRIMALAQLPLN